MSLNWQQRDGVKRLPLTAFLPLLRAGVAAFPERSDLKLQLARTLFHSDQPEEIIHLFESAVAERDAAPELLCYLGRAALMGLDYRLAFDALQSAAARDFSPAYGYLAEALHYLDQTDAALTAGLEGLDRASDDFKSLGLVARILLDRDERERLWLICLGLRERGAWGGYIPSAMALAATTPEQATEVAALIDPAKWFSVEHLAVADTFNQALAEELLEHQSITSLPSTKSTRGTGNRVSQLDIAGGPLAQELLGKIREAADRYIADRATPGNHAMVVHRPINVILNSWALTVRHDGHEAWHIHPDGWISGVYYVQVPKILPNGTPPPGAIEFGFDPFGSGRNCSSRHSWQVTPQSGLLLLFPSYYAHRTWATGVEEPRVCVAFDVLPSDLPALAR
jgi:uncharacterized protein (TIGR02466 family)